MIVNAGIRRLIGPFNPRRISGLSGWWRQGDWTSASEAVSQWNDSSGNARHLLQATGANQPIELPWSGENYGWLPSSTNNNYSAVDNAAYDLGPQSEFFFRAQIQWTLNSANQSIVAHQQPAPNASWGIVIAIAGTIGFMYSPDGTIIRTTYASVACPIADRTTAWFRVKADLTAGTINFYYAADQSSIPTSWTQWGTADRSITTGTIFPSAQPLSIGVNGGLAGATLLTGSSKWFRMQIWNGFSDSGGTKVFDADWTTVAETATSFVETSSVGATVTQGVGALSRRSQIVGSKQILGDGAASFMRASYTQAQPVTRFFLARRNLWSITGAARYTTDGVGVNSAAILDKTSTPTTAINAGSSVADNANMALNEYNAVAVVFNGASSAYYIDANAATTGNAGATTTGGLTIMADGGVPTASTFSGTQFKEVIEYNRALTATEITQVLRYLNRIGNLGLAL